MGEREKFIYVLNRFENATLDGTPGDVYVKARQDVLDYVAALEQPADGAVVVYDGIVERFHAGSVVVREGAASPSYVESGRLSHNLERFHGHRVRVTVARILEGEES